jgi:hypothetical protein
MKDQYFEIVQKLKTWMAEKLADYPYDKVRIEAKIDDAQYKFAVREKEGIAVVKEILDRISTNTLLAGA